MKYLLFFPVAMLLLISCESSSSDQTTTTQQEEPKPVETQRPPFVDIDVVQFKKRMGHPDVFVIDVRTPEEIADGKIEGAIEMNINDASFDEKVATLDKSKIYLVYCQSGIRSVTSCNKMADMGFERLYNLKGGYGAWSEAQ